MEEENKKIKLQMQDIFLLVAVLFQMTVFIIKGALPLACISVGLILIAIIHSIYNDNKKVKIVTLCIVGVYLVENAMMTYVYMPNPQLPIILFVVEIIMGIALVQNIVITIIKKEN